MKFSKFTTAIFVALFCFCISAKGGEANSPKFDDPIPPPSATPAHEKLSTPVKIIVLDPGHGGFDPGAMGPDGIKEKDVVLQVAKRLKSIIEGRTDIVVILTRDRDIFIPLRKRSELANIIGADLFISIHANAAKRGAWGFETYFLSLVASDADSRKTALQENYEMDSQPGMDAELPPDVSSDLEAILFDMEQTEYVKESEALAMIVQDRLAGIFDSPDRGVKQAPFMVLMGAAMPAVLVEIGFVSNQKEVKLLADPAMQVKIAEVLADSVVEFAKRRALRLKKDNIPPEQAEGQ